MKASEIIAVTNACATHIMTTVTAVLYDGVLSASLAGFGVLGVARGKKIRNKNNLA